MNRLPPRQPGQRVTREDLEADGQSFMDFAAAFGVAPPDAEPAPPDDDDVASGPSD